MKLPKQTKFIVANKEYEVKVWADSSSIYVQCFYDGKPAGIRFSVSDETRSDFIAARAEEPVAALVRIAVGDVMVSNSSQDAG